MNNDRRKFIRGAGVGVTAAVVGSNAGASEAESLQRKLGLLEDSNAIRALQQQYFACIQQQDTAGLSALFSGDVAPAHEGSVLDARLDDSSIDVAADRMSARAVLHTRVELGLPMSGAGTLQQMARLQGTAEQRWRETGRYEAEYVKVNGAWKIRALAWQRAV